MGMDTLAGKNVLELYINDSVKSIAFDEVPGLMFRMPVKLHGQYGGICRYFSWGSAFFR